MAHLTLNTAIIVMEQISLTRVQDILFLQFHVGFDDDYHHNY